ncbi:MAG: acyltransferase [Bacteroidales bacterium]|nr:acyltransferase [Bacteroidales bacterium]
MKFANIILGKDVEIDASSTINNVIIGDNVKIAKRCSIFGSPDTILEIGSGAYIGMNAILNGFAAKLKIGRNVSIAQNVNIMVDSGPNASPLLQKIFPIEKGPVEIGNHCWLGAGVIIMPDVKLGEYCIVAANSFVKDSFPAFSIIGGNPARLIRTFTEAERKIIMIEK